MSASAKIALVGDYSPDVTAHRAIPHALALANEATGADVEWQWLETSEIPSPAAQLLSAFDAFWCVPASPYKNMDGVLELIRAAREHEKPFLGTCGGYQHAVLEYVRNALGRPEACNAEVDPDCGMPVIGPLSCPLVEVDGSITFAPGSSLQQIHGMPRVDEGYRCSYGVMSDYVSLFDDGDFVFAGQDTDGEPRAFELRGHPFFYGTAYQPERRALSGRTHPLINRFAATVAELPRHAA